MLIWNPGVLHCSRWSDTGGDQSDAGREGDGRRQQAPRAVLLGEYLLCEEVIDKVFYLLKDEQNLESVGLIYTVEELNLYFKNI